jgi:20S proteasome alpha/beta subunit
MKNGNSPVMIINQFFDMHLTSFGPFFIEPVIAGIDSKDQQPFICSMDLIGCINFAKDFVVAGTASSNLYGICESLFEPEMVMIMTRLWLIFITS